VLGVKSISCGAVNLSEFRAWASEPRGYRVYMQAQRGERARRKDARELARTAAPDPYRGQLADPFLDQPVPDDVALFLPRSGQQVRPVRPTRVQTTVQQRPHTPSIAVAAGVLGLVAGVLIGIFGLLLFAIVSIESDLGSPDRSFYRGSDAGYVLLGSLNLGVCACLVIGSIGLMAGRLTGRILTTIGGWAALGFSAFWWDEGRAPGFVALLMAATSALILLLSYHRTVTEWLGVRPAPQPR
jgi:hypothetical protein